MQQFQHIGIEVHDLFAMERFYTWVLGFRREYRYASRNTPGLRTVFLVRGDCRVELLSRDDQALPRPGDKPRAGGHLALECEQPDEFWQAACRQAKALGIETADWKPPRQTGDGYREACLVDPEGNPVELARRLKAYQAPIPQAIIFDFDGTLADSEPNYYQAARSLLAEFGIAYSPEDNDRYVGVGNRAMLNDLIARHRLPLGYEELARRKDELYLALARASTPLFPAMGRFIGLARQSGVRLAVASGSSQAVLEELLAQMGIRGEFEQVLSSEAVPRGKPSPDVFLECARRLGVEPDACLVVEDSRPGVEAAVRAGMQSLAIPSVPLYGPDPVFGLADCLVPAGMGQFDAAAVFERFFNPELRAQKGLPCVIF